MLKNKSIAFRLRLFILLGIVIIFSTIMWIDYRSSRDILMHTVKQNATNLAQSTVHIIEGVIVAAEKIPENVAPLLEHTQYNEDEIKNFLMPIVRHNEEIFGSCVAFEPYGYDSSMRYFAPYYYRNGDSVSYKRLGDDIYDYFRWDWYQEPKELGKPVWTEPYYDEYGGDIIMATYSVPFYSNIDNQETFAGIVTVDIDLSWLSSLIDSLNIARTGYAYLLSKEGTFLSHPDQSLIMNESIFTLAEKYNNIDLLEIGNEMVEGKSGFVRFRPLSLEGYSWLYYTHLPNSGWSIAIVFPEDELLADLHFLFLTLVALALGGIVLIFVVITVISNRITRPIEKLAKVSAKFGSGHFDVSLPKVKRNDEIGQLTDSFRLMREELKKYVANLKETTAAKNRIESELKIAHDIQQGIIPKIFPPFPDREDVDLYAVLDPAKEVGGDLYDFFFLDDKRLVFAIGDVSGKGVPASLFMAITRTLLRAKAVGNISSPEIVTNINKELCIDNDNAMFVTFFLGILNLETGDLDFCNAGHNYPYILKTGKPPAQLNQTHGTPLGLFEEIKYKSGNMKIEKGDSLVLYTDGIPEAMDIVGNLFGDPKLEDILIAFDDEHSPEKITKKLLEDTKTFESGAEQSDDITILVLTYYNNYKVKTSTNEFSIDISNKVEEISKMNALIDQACEAWSIDVAHGHKVNLALEEIVSNIINYSFTTNTEHSIHISLHLIEDIVRITVSDDGKAFNPLEKKDPDSLDKSIEEREIGGLGIYFVKQFMDHVEYRRDDGKNILTFEKNLKD